MYAQAIAAMWPTTTARRLVVSWPGVLAIIMIEGPSAANSHGCLSQKPIIPARIMSSAEIDGTQIAFRMGATEPPRSALKSFGSDSGAPDMVGIAPGVG